ncbi:hypothetical protein NP233_g842 [Leucocoprinus birnbaumii]|uniref:Pre-rRNA-processing protein RIX1 n=1 Tax=Leucocoprinus birnbaumii TaxID=56174 RepID=A0AAD5W1G2_9AGAR|nr:hypothetical protein NP233_g842 [Leucocoprinus birnbaumii]
MSEHHSLKSLLNIHLASDTSAVLHLHFILNTLTVESLAPSPHLPKWTARVQSLLHSRDAGGRWAGLVLAQKTAILSQELLLENGQTWVGVALPLLSKNDPAVVLKAAIRLLRTIFTRSHEAPEFRRHVAIPTIPKLLAILIPLVEQTRDLELKIVALTALVNLIPLYPTLHKASYPALSGLALRFLDGQPHAPVSQDLLSAASRLYSVIHVTGGKVGASSLWRKTLEETLNFGTNAFWSLRTTFVGQPPGDFSLQTHEDPVTLIPLHLDRLQCAVTIIDDLFGAIVYRPVQLPLGVIVRFALRLLQTSDNSKRDGFVDPTIHSLELSMVSKIQALGCSLITSLVDRLDGHMYPHRTQILRALSILLEHQKPAEHRVVLLQTLKIVLARYPSSHSSLISTRLMKAVLPSVSRILITSGNIEDARINGTASAKGRKGKKKAQNFEGEEVFSSTRAVLCPADADGELLLAALDVVRLLLRDHHLSAAMQSISVRVLIAIMLTVIRIPPATLSSDPGLYPNVMNKLHGISTEITTGTSSVLSKSLPFIVTALGYGGSNVAESQRQLDLLLHPRLPPVIRPMPLAESLSLMYSEEADEEAGLRKSLGIFSSQDELLQHRDLEMESPAVLSLPPAPKPTVVASITTQPPVQPVSLSQLKGKEKATAAPEPTSTLAGSPTEEQYRSSVIEAPKLRSSQPPTTSQQTEASSSTQKAPTYNVPGISAEDEDEEMPAIDLDSDSEIE